MKSPIGFIGLGLMGPPHGGESVEGRLRRHRMESHAPRAPMDWWAQGAQNAQPHRRDVANRIRGGLHDSERSSRAGIGPVGRGRCMYSRGLRRGGSVLGRFELRFSPALVERPRGGGPQRRRGAEIFWKAPVTGRDLGKRKKKRRVGVFMVGGRKMETLKARRACAERDGQRKWFSPWAARARGQTVKARDMNLLLALEVEAFARSGWRWCDARGIAGANAWFEVMQTSMGAFRNCSTSKDR